MKSVRIIALILLTCAAAAVQGQQQQPPAQAGAQGQRGGRGGGRGQEAPDPRTMGGGQCSANPWNCVDTPNPLPLYDTVWTEEMTWMDVRDALKLGKDTIIIATGGLEPNGPFLATGKHNYVLRANCEAIARKLGTALCAPIVKFVPEGDHEPASGHMRSPGTVSLREETFDALLTDIATSYKVSGFKNIMFIGDSGGNVNGMWRVSEALSKKWPGVTVAHIREHYMYNTVGELLTELGVTETKRDGLHDDPGITLNMMATDPDSVRYEQRVKAGLATINGVSIADLDRSLELARKIVDMRSTNTANAIKKAIETKGTSAVRPPQGQRGNRGQ
jgi:creatinine amidohydrolase/Fe(II)-dependent formamide hydrolase-like protein